MRQPLLLLFLCILTVSCKDKKEDLIVKKWQAVSLESPMMNRMITEQEQFLDTFGKNTSPEANDSLYGTRNVDSMRESLRAQLEEFKAMQAFSVQNTWFHFRNDGVVVLNFSGQPDSANWYFEEDNVLMLDEMKLKGIGSKIKMDIVKLEDTVLKLRFTEDGLTSTVTLHPKEK